MDITWFILMVVILLAEVFFFQGNMAALIVAVLASVGYLVFRIFFKKKCSKPVGSGVSFLFMITLGVCILLLGVKGEQAGFILYAEDVEQVSACIHREDYDKAAELLGEMEEVYGETDTTRMLAAINYLSVGQYEDALKEYQHIADKTTMTAIIIAEQIYSADSSGQYTDDLYDLYCDAAELYPDWEYIQLCTGVFKIDFKQYESAQYYLYNAYAVNAENPQTLYFLGLSAYKLGDEESALYYFNESVECGADDTLKSLIKYYLDEMDYFGKGKADK